MATNVFGDVIEEVSTSSSNVNEFGDVIDISASETVTPLAIKQPDPLQVFGEQFTREQQAPFNQQINALVSQTPDVISSLFKTAVEGGSGVQELQAQDSISDRLKRALLGSVFPPLALSGNEAQTTLEAGQRALDIGPQIKQALDRFLADPSTAITNALTPERLATALTVSPLASLFQPSTPSQEQISQRFIETQQAPEVALQRQEPRVPEIFGTANIPASEAGALALQAAPVLPGAVRTGLRVAETIASPVSRAVSRGLTTPVIERATGLIGVGESEGLVDILQASTPRILESTPLNAIKNSKDLVKASNTAQTAALSEAKQYLGQAGESGLVMDGNIAIQNTRTSLLDNYPSLADSPEEANRILNSFEYLNKPLKPIDGQKRLRELNLRYEALENKKTPEAFAYKAIRSELSNQLDEIVKATSGKDISPYRDWGQIEEFKTGVQESIIRAETSAGRTAVPTSPDAPSGLPLGTGGRAIGGSVARALTRAARPLIKQPLEFVDEAAKAVIKGSPKAVKRVNLSADEVAKLKAKYVSKPPVLEELIRKKIQSYPPNIRNDPTLSRIIAEQELGL